MAEIIDTTDLFTRKTNMTVVMRGLAEAYGQAGEVADQFAALAERDITAAILEFPVFIKRARSSSGPMWSMGEALGGGPNPDWIMPVINTIGQIYHAMPRNAREAFLCQVMQFLDGLNWLYSQNHVKLIQEPLLVADIVINRTLYFPGLEAETRLLQGYEGHGLKEYPLHELGTWWVCACVMWHSDAYQASRSLRSWYYAQFPDLVDQALDFVAPLLNSWVEADVKEGGNRDECLRTRLWRRFDPALHERICARVAEQKWIVLPQ